MGVERVISSTENVRCLGRLQARELSASEIEAVGAGASYTGISNFKVDYDGRVTFDYGDYTP